MVTRKQGLPAHAAATLLLAACASTDLGPPSFTLEPHVFAARDGRTVEAELGRFTVPENRADPGSRLIELGFVRFRSTAENPGNPIVYLAGGPGGAGTDTARNWRFDIFMALRAQADVIAYDQRGTGLSYAPPDCEAGAPFDFSAPLTRAAIVEAYRAEASRCLAWWREAGVDIAAWNTRENAADIEDLRRAIGAERIDLWAISYGTHLGAAYLRDHHERVGRAVFAGYEGPDDTVKMPAHTDAMLARFAAVVAADLTGRQAYGDVLELMRRVLTRLEAEPATVTITVEGEPVTMRLGAFPLQFATGGMISDPRRAVRLLPLYAAMDRGDFAPMAEVVRSVLAEETASMRAMSLAMDIASGINASRLALVERQAQTSLLGDALNFPMPHLVDVAPELDLGDRFRAPLAVSTPILFISGTLDGRTYPEAAQAALRSLPNSRLLLVENGGHNIYEADPRMQDVVRTWFHDGVAPETMSFPPPAIPTP